MGKLIASAGTLDGAVRMASQYLMGTQLAAHPCGDGRWQLHNSKGPTAFDIIHKAKRFRVESVDRDASGKAVA
jgi:hypothetical protein